MCQQSLLLKLFRLEGQDPFSVGRGACTTVLIRIAMRLQRSYKAFQLAGGKCPRDVHGFKSSKVTPHKTCTSHSHSREAFSLA